MLPVMKKIPSGDQARSYISDPDDLHIVFTLHTSFSSPASSPIRACRAGFSEGTQSKTLPSSPAEPSISPGWCQYLRVEKGYAMSTSRTPSDNVDGLCVFDERRKILDSPIISTAFESPKLK